MFSSQRTICFGCSRFGNDISVLEKADKQWLKHRFQMYCLVKHVGMKMILYCDVGAVRGGVREEMLNCKHLTMCWFSDLASAFETKTLFQLH